MFRNFQSTSRGDKSTGGRYVDAVAAVTAGADDIGKQIIRSRERRSIFQQGSCRPGDFIRVLAANFHAHQRRRQLFGLQFAANYG